MPALSRRERERQMRREAMLDAARAVFAEKGYTHATLDEIAQRAEFGKGTLYNYFEGGKEALLFAVFDDLYNGFHDIILAAFTPERLAGRAFRAVLQQFIEDILTFFWEQQDLFMILIKEAYRMTFGEDQEKAQYFMKHHARMVGTLAKPLEAAIDRGDLRPLPPHAVAHMVLGNVEGVVMHMTFRHMQDGPFPVPECGPAAPPTPAESAAFLTTMLFDGLSGPDSIPAPQPIHQPHATLSE